MNTFQLAHSPFSAFVPFKPESQDKTECSKNSNVSSFGTSSGFQFQMSAQIAIPSRVLSVSDTNFNSLEKKPQKKERKGSLKIKRENAQFDFEYKPNKRSNKKEPNAKLNQNRNILPNTIHQLFSFAQRRNRSGKIVERIFKKYESQCSSLQGEDFNINRFYIYQKALKNKIGNYVTEESLKNVCKNQITPELFQSHQERFYNKIFRILLLSYLHQESDCSVLMSKRMYNDKKIQHLKTNRYIIQRMKSQFAKEE